MENTQCSAQVIYDSWCHTHRCEKRAKVTRNGKPYCTVHDPEYIAQKGAKKTAKYYAKSASERARWELVSIAVSACKAINPDNPMAVAESISDLYEALKALTHGYDTAQKRCKEQGMNFRESPHWAEARQAIAKAEGKAPH